MWSPTLDLELEGEQKFLISISSTQTYIREDADFSAQEENDFVTMFQNIMSLDRVELLVNIGRLSVPYEP
jgi:hypothetical protein